MTQSIIDTYQQLIDNNQLSVDSAQLAAVVALDDLTLRLKWQEEQQQSQQLLHNKIVTFFDKLTLRKKNKTIVKGLYFHGRVGRGKTMLMDLFYQQLTIKKKQRIHFHRFMESVHQQLNQLSTKSKLANPLVQVAKTWAKKVDVLCFDEFFVTDIGDAMLLAGLLEALFSEGVTLVATSNCQPEQLYRNGLQRERFVPTIALIKQHCQIMSIDGEVDHRMADFDEQASHVKSPYRDYVYPYNSFPQFLENRFLSQCSQSTNHLVGGVLRVNNREVNYLAKTKSAIYFDFYALCSGPRSQKDYIRLADQFKSIFISRVPQFSGELIPSVFSGVEDSYQRSGVLMANLRHLDDEARRFIALVDEFYDQKVQLVITAEVDISQLYKGQQLSFEFARCQSRLFEMQKISYDNQ